MAPEQYKCQMCGAAFSSESELKGHAKKEHNKCEACSATFKSQSELMEHAKKEHKKS